MTWLLDQVPGEFEVLYLYSCSLFSYLYYLQVLEAPVSDCIQMRPSNLTVLLTSENR